MAQSTQVTRKGQDADLGAVRWKRTVVSKGANYTVTAEETGTHFIATAADLVFTLPSTAVGLTYRFSITAGALSSGTGLSISPASADKIMGNGFTAADNKDAINSGASDREHDMIELTGDAAGDGWIVTGVIGTWARES